MTDQAYAIQATFKFGPQYKEAMINVPANSVAELEQKLDYIINNPEKFVQAQQALLGVSAVADGLGATSVNQGQQQEYQHQQSGGGAATSQGWSNDGGVQQSGRTQYSQPDNSQPPTCMHGPKKWVPGGTSKRTGQAYNGFWACSAPQGQQCKN